MEKGKSAYFGRIWAHFLGLRGAPMVMNVRYGPPRHQQGRWTWQRHSIIDFMLGWPLTLLIERGRRQIWLFWAYLGSFFGPEGGPYGHECMVWSTWTWTRKVDMIPTFPGRFEARMFSYYAIWAWTKANLVSLGVFGLIFWAWGWPLWPQMRGMVHLDTDKEGGHDIDIPREIWG